MRPILLTFLAALTLACRPDPVPVGGEPGEPLPGLAAEEQARFQAGLALFNKVYTQEEGLGPAFNENQCSACHTVPAAGGTTALEPIVKATRYRGPGECDLLSEEGGENVRKQATPLLQAHGHRGESVPGGATEVARFLPTFLFGLGLVEAIPEETILAGADPDDEDGDGISGRPARAADGALMRFGRKADHTTIEQFTRSALRLEMGLTTRGGEVDRVDGGAPPAGTDPAADPEVDERTVALLTDFTRFLVPTAPFPARSDEHAAQIATGERLFGALGCTKCHTPTMRTGRTDIAALSRKTVRVYSDLLLHDMGPGLSSVCGPDAAPRELRTAILTGLAHRKLFLHDGRTIDLREAILEHGGEAGAVRDAYARLPWLQQEYLVIFLRSL